MKPFPQLMFSAFIIIVSFLAFFSLSLIVAAPVFGLDSIFNFSGINDLSDPGNIRILKYFQVVQSAGLFIAPPLILAWFFHGKIPEYLILNRKFSLNSLLLVILLVIFSQPFINLTGMWNSNMELPEWLSEVEDWMKNAEDNAAKLTEAFLKIETTGGMLFNLFMIALLPAIGEELLFRGVIQRIFSRWTNNYHWGIWLTAILFSALHIQFYGFMPRMLLGVMFGYLLVWTGTLWMPVIAHFVNNGFAVITLWLIDKGILTPDVENIGSTSGSYYTAVVSAVIVCLILWWLQKENKRESLIIKPSYP
jgi:uncharacterized protein